VKRLLQRSALFGLTLALGVGLPLRQTIVRAQAAGVASASPAQAADAEKKPPQQDETDAYRKSPHVVEWGAKLGLNPGQSFIAFDVANFLLLVAAAGWVLMKTGVPFLQIGPVPQILRDRSAAIQKHLVDARTATEEARARLSGVEARLAKLDDEIAAMRAHAEQDSAREEQRIKASVEDEKRKILTEAEHEITVATMHAQKLLQQHAAELAIEQAARKLVVSAETDRLLVQGFAQRLSGDESKKGQN
jgi:F-type H+-transporting ATPase subunit b